jgi:glycosyltransferase involved in cell wall biosynthesis
MNKFTICITTFSKRFDYLKKLINQIRSFSDVDVIVAVNGDYKKVFDNDYRTNVLKLCSDYPYVFPIFFPEQRGLSKLWNTLIIHSKTDWCLMLNDDIELTTDDFHKYGNNNLDVDPDLLRINGSFSHFFLHKKCIDDLGYFDERLLGFGEEDGDVFFRYIEKYDRWIKDVYIHGFNNLVIDVRDDEIRRGVGKYSAFNREFCFLSESPKYVSDASGISGMFGQPMKKNLPDECLYPYESFFTENKNKL